MDEHPSSDVSLTPEVPEVEVPRSRRSILAMGLGGIAGAVAATVAQAVPAAAAPGKPMIIGASNLGGATVTSIKSSSSSSAFKATDTSGVNGAAAVRGAATTAGGMAAGVIGTTVSSNTASAGVVGTATVGQGVEGLAGGNLGWGVLGVANGPNGCGVRGHGAGASSVGVLGASTSASGVVGSTTGTTAGTAGVVGQTGTTSNVVHGVYGTTSSSSTVAAGVTGASSTNGGQAIMASGSSGAWGVWAISSTYALVASGDVSVTGDLHVAGTLTKGAGAFRIDHPLDPENRYLQHSFVESPEMKNVYDGVVTLGATGRATVRLPRWFEALNRDFRYQLTAIGAPAPGLHIAKGVAGNRFTIAGGAPGQEVSWQVTGVRHDAYAVEHPIRVEIAKRGDDRGRLLHPTENGRSRSLRLSPVQSKSRALRRRPLRTEVQRKQPFPVTDD